MTLQMAQRAADIAKEQAKRNKNSVGLCTLYIALALEKAGFKFERQGHAYQYHKNDELKKIGFTAIQTEEFCKGDICVVDQSNSYSHGYIAIYDGENWISDFIHQSHDTFCLEQKGKIWLQEVNGFDKNDQLNGYSGLFGKTVTSLRISGGQQYRVHLCGGNWLPPVTGNDQNECNNGYAGTKAGSPIDCVAISGGVRYAVHIQGGDWLEIVNGYDTGDYNNGYAGIPGKCIDAVMIQGRTYATSYNI